MKKILSIVIILLLALTLVACNSSKPTEDDKNLEKPLQPSEDEVQIEDVEKEEDKGEDVDEQDSAVEDPLEEDLIQNNRDDHYEDDDKQVVSLYFVNDHYMETGDESLDPMVVEEREIDYTTKSLEEAIIRELMNGPKAANASTNIPQKAKLLGVEVRDGTAFVDFAREGMHGGSSQEIFTIKQIVSSLGQLNHIHQVQFLIDGEIEESLMGHITIDEPFEVEN